MEALRHLTAGMDTYIPGQHGIEHKGVFLRRNPALRIKVDSLPQGVNCICPGGAGDDDAFLRGFLQCFLQYLLYSQTVDLPLPAGIIRAVIFDGQQDAFHANSPFSAFQTGSVRWLSVRTSRISNAIPAAAYQSFFVIFSTRSRVRFSPP